MKQTDNLDNLAQTLISWFQEDINHVSEWRQSAREDYAFYNGDQWDEADLRLLRDQKRPVMTFNRIAPLINAVIGSERNNKRRVQFVPRSIGEAEASELLTGAAEWFRDQADAEYEDSEAFTDTVICGMGWTDTRLDYENNPDGEPVIARLDPLKMVWDSSAIKPNLVDANRLWYIDEKPLEVAREMFPNHHWSELDAYWAKNINGDYQSAYEANVSDAEYSLNMRRRMVTLVECRWFEREPYFKGRDPQTGEIREYSETEYQYALEKAPHLQAVRLTRKSVRRAFLGKSLLAPPDKPLVPFGQLGWECITGYFDKGKKLYYGIVRPTKDPQRWANKYFSQVMYLLNSQSKGGIMAERGAFDDDRQAETSWARADTITWTKSGAVTSGRIQPKPTAQFPVGFFQLFNEAKEAIWQSTGLSPEFVGNREVNQPGVLEEQRRQSSLNLLATLFDSLRRYRKRQGQIMLYLIQNYLSDGRLIHIVGQDKKRYVPLVREDLANSAYDIIVDDAPTSPNEKERNFEIINQILPLFKDYMTPEMSLDILRYSPLPASLVDRWIQKFQQAKTTQTQLPIDAEPLNTRNS